LAFLACNTFQAFIALNLKPQILKGRTRAFFSQLMTTEIYESIYPALSPRISDAKGDTTFQSVRRPEFC